MHGEASELVAGDRVNSEALAISRHSISTDRVDLNISERDGMLQGNREHYFRVGRGALAAVQTVASMWGNNEFESILDFGCGHGRVLRWLRAAYPNAELVASDILDDGVAFCAEAFVATPWLATIDIETLNASKRFDLIWAGSVITHLPEKSTQALLNKFVSWLRPGGIAVFSSHGRTALRKQGHRPFDYFAGGNQTAAIGGYYRDGYGYADYPNLTGYGCSFIRVDWLWRFLEGNPDVDLVSVTEAAWDFHQDVVSVKRV
ncbi:MAG: class I SAM-dependent methyltransferase [Methylocella sp.]